jgi:hypothetical protein
MLYPTSATSFTGSIGRQLEFTGGVAESAVCVDTCIEGGAIA